MTTRGDHTDPIVALGVKMAVAGGLTGDPTWREAHVHEGGRACPLAAYELAYRGLGDNYAIFAVSTEDRSQRRRRRDKRCRCCVLDFPHTKAVHNLEVAHSSKDEGE